MKLMILLFTLFNFIIADTINNNQNIIINGNNSGNINNSVVNEFKSLQKLDKNFINKKEDFSSLKNNIADVSKFKYLFEKKENKLSILETIETMNNYNLISIPEYQYLKKMYDMMINKEFKSTVFFYLYSTSMPIENIIQFAQDISLIQRYDHTAKGYVVFRGINGVEKTLEKLKLEIDSPFVDYSHIAHNINIKLDPRFFQKLDAKKVPYTIMAECTNKHIFDNCKYLFTQKGSISLTNFLNDVNLVDPDNYGRYYNYIISPD